MPNLTLRDGFSAQASLVGVTICLFICILYNVTTWRRPTCGRRLGRLTTYTPNLHLVMGTGPVNWRRLEVSFGVSYDAHKSPRFGQPIRRLDYLSFPGFRRIKNSLGQRPLVVDLVIPIVLLIHPIPPVSCTHQSLHVLTKKGTRRTYSLQVPRMATQT
jgi:hypothetical protein